MNRLRIVIVSVTTLLITSAVVVASRNRQQPAPPPDAPVAALPSEVRVKAVERNPVAATTTAAFHNKTMSLAGNCGIIFANESNADKCEEERICERAHRPVHDVLAL